MRCFRPALLLLVTLLAGGGPLRAQGAPPVRPTMGVVAQVQSGLPARAEPPRTLRAQAHVYIAFAVAWVLLFGYALWLGRRLVRLERELGRLGEGPPA